MCYAKPGPRCSNHALKTLSNARKVWNEAHTSAERSIAMKTLKEAEEQYDATPAGQHLLEELSFTIGDLDGLYTARLEHGIAKRKQMLRDIKTKDVGDIDDSPAAAAPRVHRHSPRRFPDTARSIISPDGTKRWYLNGKLNRDGDKPAVEHPTGTKEWYLNGELHREGDKPAVEYADGGKDWYLYGKLNREGDKPAVVGADGTKVWCLDGVLHREGDKPAVVLANGAKGWYINGKCHRGDDKPAYEGTDGSREWLVNGECHREGDKPAVVDAYGNKFWYLNGKMHRENDKPAAEYADGTREWWVNGERTVIAYAGQKPLYIGIDTIPGSRLD